MSSCLKIFAPRRRWQLGVPTNFTVSKSMPLCKEQIEVRRLRAAVIGLLLFWLMWNPTTSGRAGALGGPYPTMKDCQAIWNSQSPEMMGKTYCNYYSSAPSD